MSSDETKAPRVFISYSQDSPQHKNHVFEFSNRLRDDGIDCMLDLYVMSPPEGWPLWMIHQIQVADFILMICTPRYYIRAMGNEQPGIGHGARWEANLIYLQFYDDGTLNTKIIPILFDEKDYSHIPDPYRGTSHYCPITDAGYEDLYRLLTNQPLYLQPKLGKLRKMPPLERKDELPSALPQSSEPITYSSPIDNHQQSTSTTTHESDPYKEDTPMQLLTLEERQKLISLLCKLPDIKYANVQHSLVSTLPAHFQSNISFDNPAEVQVTEIVEMLIHEGKFRLSNGFYPIMVVIQNAINKVKNSQLESELQSLLDTLKKRFGVLPKFSAVTTPMNNFLEELDNFIHQMPAIQYELQYLKNCFGEYIVEPECSVARDHLTELCSPLLDFYTVIKQSHLSQSIWLTDALWNFNKQAKVVQETVDLFCMTYDVVLEQDEPAQEREKIQQQLDMLIRLGHSVLDTAEKLYYSKSNR